MEGAFMVLAVGFGLIERFWPASPTRRARWGLDVAWWVLGRIVDPAVKAVTGLLLVGPLLLQGHGWVATQPAAVQLVGALSTWTCPSAWALSCCCGSRRGPDASRC